MLFACFVPLCGCPKTSWLTGGVCSGTCQRFDASLPVMYTICRVIFALARTETTCAREFFLRSESLLFQGSQMCCCTAPAHATLAQGKKIT